MSKHFVGTIIHRSGGAAKTEYVVIDDQTGSMVNYSKTSIAHSLKKQEGVFCNMKLENGELMPISGNIVRYYEKNGNDLEGRLVILRKSVYKGKVIGYRVWSRATSMADFSVKETINRGRVVGIANAKIVEGAHGAYIASLVGEFETTEIKYGGLQRGEELSIDEFMGLLRFIGCEVSLNYMDMVIRHKDGIEIENLSLPISEKEMNVHFETKVRIKNLSVFSSKMNVNFPHGAVIDNMDLVGNGAHLSYINISNATIGTCNIVDGMKNLREVNIGSYIKVLRGGKNLETIRNSFNSGEIESVDLRECQKGEDITLSFNVTDGDDLKVWLGSFYDYNSSFAMCCIKLMNKFDGRVERLNGFNYLINVKKLDLSEYRILTSLGGFANSSIEEIILPKDEGLFIEADLCRGVEMDYVDATHNVVKLGNNAFRSTKTVYIKSDLYVEVTSNSERQGVLRIQALSDGSSKLPRIQMDGKGEKFGLKFEFEEGTKKIKAHDNLNGLRVEEIKLPESLEIIGKNAFMDLKIKKINLKDSNVKVIEEAAFKGANVGIGFVICPESLKIIGDRAFHSDGISALYIPENIEKIGRIFYKGSLAYVYKGSIADDKNSKVFKKVYVKSVQDVLDILYKNNSTEKELAKIKMAMQNKEGYGWLKREEFKGHSKMLIDIERSMKNGIVSTDNIVMNTEKLIKFNIKGLGELGSALVEYAEESRMEIKSEKLTDRFKSLCNVFTASTRFYAGHFTKKALEMYTGEESIENQITDAYTRAIYSDEHSAILVTRLPGKKNSKAARRMYAVVITLGENIVYTTVVNGAWIGLPFGGITGIGSRVEEYLMVGDKIPKNGGYDSTVGLKPLPTSISKMVENYIKMNTFKLRETGETGELLSLNTGRLYRVKNGHIVGIEESSKHKFQSDLYSLEQESPIKYYDLINGVIKGEKRVMPLKKARIVEVLEKLRAEYTEPSSEVMLRMLEELGAKKIKIQASKVYKDMKTKEYGYNIISMDTDKAFETAGFSMGSLGRVYAYVKGGEEGGKLKVEALLTPYKIDDLDTMWKEYVVDESVQEPKMFSALVGEQEEKKYFMSVVYVRGGFAIGIAKHNGYSYLLKCKNLYSQDQENTLYVLGIVRDDEEAYKKIYGAAVLYDNNGEPELDIFRIADKARRGEIPAGEYVEYTSANTVYELIGL